MGSVGRFFGVLDVGVEVFDEVVEDGAFLLEGEGGVHDVFVDFPNVIFAGWREVAAVLGLDVRQIWRGRANADNT